MTFTTTATAIVLGVTIVVLLREYIKWVTYGHRVASEITRS